MLYNFFFFLRLVLFKLTGKTYPLTVIFNVTDRCNLRCKHCYASYYKRDAKEMSTEQIKKLLNDLKVNGCLRINFCGGEPLLRPDIKELIDYAKSIGLSVDLTSNGVLVPKRIEDIKGIKCLTISLDGRQEHHDLLRGKGSWEKAMEAIKIARKNGIDVRVNMVLHKFNLDDIDYMISLAKKNNFKIHISLAISNISGEKPLID
ncbi:MAG: radical SAM protein, partial [Actinobacteria bacterium]|nr:radical SAM protein [Actinomycetota bacterium]